MTALAERLELRWRNETHEDDLSTLDEYGSLCARLGAATIEALARLLVDGDEFARGVFIDRLAEYWQWTEIIDRKSEGSEPAWSLVELEVDRPALTWPEGIEHGEVVEWVAEGLERRTGGSGTSYRKWCAMAGRIRAPCGKPEETHIFSRSNATVHGIDVDVDTGYPLGVLRRHVSREQLAWCYWALPETVRTARTVLRFLARVADADEERRLIEVIAPKAITDEKGEDSASARDALAVAIRANIRQLRDIAFKAPLPTNATDADKLATELDEAFAAHVGPIGDTGKKIANTVRSTAGKRTKPGEQWKLWQHEADGELFLVLLGRTLWADKVRSQIYRLERNTPALTYVVHDDVTRIHSRAYTLEDRAGQRALVFDEGDPIVLTPAMAEEAMAKLICRGADLLGSVTAHRALRWEVTTGYERVMRGEADARTLSVDGGWSVFAELLGLTKKQHAEDLKAIVHAQAAVLITLPDGSRGNMLALRDSPAVGRRRGKVEIVLGTMLLPHYVYELNEHVSGRRLSESKRLVPVAQLPPFVGRANDHGAQATASMLVMRELRAHAADLFRDGSVRIALGRWAVLFHEARLPSSMIGKVLERWTRDGDDGPAFLKSIDRDAYTLGDAYKQARAFLVDAGKRESDGREAGKRSVQSREAKRRRAARSTK